MRSVISISAVLAIVIAVSGCSSGRGSVDPSGLDASLGDAALNAGTPDVALRLADETLAKSPNDARALVRRGVALTVLGRLDEARESLQKAAAIDPTDSKTRLALGRVQLPVDPAAAEVSFQMAIRPGDPNAVAQNAVALNNLGIARDLLGQHAEAETAYRGALAASPDMMAAQVNLALSLAIRGQGAQAVALLRPLAESPGASRKVREDYAAVLAMTGERQEAERILAANMTANEVAPALDMLASLRTMGDSFTR